MVARELAAMGKAQLQELVPTKATQRGPMVRIVKRPVDLQSGAKSTGFGCNAQEKIVGKTTIRRKTPTSPQLPINFSRIRTLSPIEVVNQDWIMRKLKILMVAGAATMLSSCDLSQIPGLTGKLSMEDSKAVGAACRHSGRALEDCFTLNPSSHQSGVFEGWRDMNDYMLANEIEVVKPEIRNSAFRQEKTSLDSPVLPGTPVESGSAALDTPQEAVPLAQGRQRWLPKGVENPAMNESAVTPPAAADKAETAATAPATSPEDIPAAKEAPAVESPARPWERKKDPKKHT
jgi:hypothetical protein